MNVSYVIIESGTVVNVTVQDGEDEFAVSDNLQFIDISDISEQSGIGWTYSDGVFTAPLPPERSHDEPVAGVEQKRQSLIDAAVVNISVIQLKLQVRCKLTQEETTRFNVVLGYIETVAATNTNTAPDVTWSIFPASRQIPSSCVSNGTATLSYLSDTIASTQGEAQSNQEVRHYDSGLPPRSTRC